MIGSLIPTDWGVSAAMQNQFFENLRLYNKLQNDLLDIQHSKELLRLIYGRKTKPRRLLERD